MDKTGIFIYSAKNLVKGLDINGFRSKDPASCNATTSVYPGDLKNLKLSINCYQESYVDSQGKPSFSYSNTNYDPRVRPWYVSAKATGGPVWSPIYLFFTGDLGITYAVPVYDSTKALVGVIGVDYNLRDIEKTMISTLSPGIVQYVIVTNTFDLVATTVGERLSCEFHICELL